MNKFAAKFNQNIILIHCQAGIKLYHLMCGILGYFSNKTSVTKSHFYNALLKIKHRGPEDQSVKEFNTGFLGHNRLAIIDLQETANQPFSIDNRYHLIFNGEIYNYLDVKQKLINEHHTQFTTNSDTEVLIQAYKYYGEKCLSMCNGMFAFALLDTATNELFLARDRVGKKPLFYTTYNNSIAFGSELKGILPLLSKIPQLSHYSINEFLSIGYIISPRTIYENIFKLEPAHWLKVNLDSFETQKQRYWEPMQSSLVSFDEDLTKHLIQDAIDIRYNSDVPVGIMLSGGLDSNIVLGLSKAKSPKTFTIKTDHQEYDESDIAELSAKYYGVENVSKIVSPEVSILDKVVHFYDEPLGDSSAIPSFLLSKFIHSDQYKCVLNGDGADEVFAGYDRYKLLLIYHHYRLIRFAIPSLSFKSFKYKSFFYNLNKLKTLLREQSITAAYAEQNLINKGFEGEALKDMSYKEEIIHRINSLPVSNLNKFLVYDYKYYLPDDLLVKMDRASMAHSLEARSPFLDYRLAEIFLNVDFENKISLKKNKKHLRKLYNDLLPNNILNRKKTGFQIPIDHWFLNELKEEIEGLKNSQIIKNGFVDKKYIDWVVDTHLSKKQNLKFQLYLLLIFEKWFQKWTNQ